MLPKIKNLFYKFKVKLFRETLALVVIVFIILAFRSSIYEPFKIPTGSMIPTLAIGDFIVVNKFAYGLKLPFSDFLSNPIYLTKQSEPKRWDVIVFKFPKDQSLNYVKRVVGLPGDTIEIKNKELWINGTKVEEGPQTNTDVLDNIQQDSYNVILKKIALPHKTFLIQYDQDNFFKADFPRTVIPKDQYFVMGDNRDFSYDSRFWGLVSSTLIKGRVERIWLSMDFFVGDSFITFRAKRIGKRVD